MAGRIQLYSRIMALSAGLLITIVCGIYWHLKSQLDLSVQHLGNSDQAVFEQELRASATSMEQIATVIAGDSRVIQLMAEARQARGKSHDYGSNARARSIQKRLLDDFRIVWHRLVERFQFGELRFYLEPDSNSFLCIDAQGECVSASMPDTGDENTAGSPGQFLRSSVPVFFTEPGFNLPTLIGTVESVNSFESILKTIKQKTGLDITILVTDGPSNSGARAQYRPHATTGNNGNIQPGDYSGQPVLSTGTQVFRDTGKYIASTGFPVNTDTINGWVIIERNITAEKLAFSDSVIRSIKYAILTFISVAIIVYAGMNVCVRRRKEARSTLSGADTVEPDQTAVNAFDSKIDPAKSIFDSVMENSPAIISVKDLNGRYQKVNNCFEKFAGLTGQQILGKTDSEIFPDNSSSLITRNDQLALEALAPTQFEERHALASGERTFLSARFAIRNCWGRIVSIGNISTDITEHKCSEEERLSRVVQQKEALVREVHHRIKNHLQGLSGLVTSHVLMATKQCRSCPPVQAVESELQSIAVVHGLQSHRTDEHICLYKMTESICKSTQRIHAARISIEKSSNTIDRIFILPGESVSLALIINEIITNAVKHATNSNPGVLVRLSAELDVVAIEVQNNGSYSTAAGEADTTGKSGLGLELIDSLLPEEGTRFTLSQNDRYVVARLVLQSPVIEYIDENIKAINGAY